MSKTLDDKEKILKVISKAILGGWDKDIAAGFIQIIPDMFTDEYPDAKDSMIRSVLLEHGFAKAFFGEEPNHIENVKPIIGVEGKEIARAKGFYTKKNWQYNLQQAVLADDIIDYYYKQV